MGACAARGAVVEAGRGELAVVAEREKDDVALFRSRRHASAAAPSTLLPSDSRSAGTLRVGSILAVPVSARESVVSSRDTLEDAAVRALGRPARRPLDASVSTGHASDAATDTAPAPAAAGNTGTGDSHTLPTAPPNVPDTTAGTSTDAQRGGSPDPADAVPQIPLDDISFRDEIGACACAWCWRAGGR